MLDIYVYADETSYDCDIFKYKVIIQFKWGDAHNAFSKHSRVDKPIVSQTDRASTH